MRVQLGAEMRTQEEIYNAKGERIFTRDEQLRGADSISKIDSKNVVIGILIGICGGWIASFAVGGSGFVHYLITGVLGSFVGSAILQKLDFNLGLRNEIARDIATATFGAIIVMAVAHFLT